MDFYATTTPGFEREARDELMCLGAKEVSTDKGGVAFSGPFALGMKACLWSRTLNRVVLRLASFECTSYHELERKAGKVQWAQWIAAESGVDVRVTVRGTRLNHKGKVADKIKGALRRRKRGQGDGYKQAVLVRFLGDECTLSLDMCGELLYRRGYGTAGGPATLRETTACSVLDALGWSPRAALVNPMCGSGTFLVEAALQSLGEPPQKLRQEASWPFVHWPAFDRDAFERALAGGEPEPLLHKPYGFDWHDKAVKSSKKNLKKAKVSAQVNVVQKDLKDESAPTELAEEGVIVTNPPYGKRLGKSANLKPLYKTLGTYYSAYKGWTGGLLATDPALIKSFLSAVEVENMNRIRFEQGGLSVELCRFKIVGAPS